MIGKQNMSVKLGMAFAAVLAFIFAAGIVNYFNLNRLSNEVEVLYISDTVGSTLLGDTQDQMWQLRYGVSQFVAVPSLRESIIQESPKQYAKLEEALKQYSTSGTLAGEEKQMLKTFTDAFAEYKEARPKWFEIFMSGKLEEAAKFREATILASGARCVKALTALIDLHRKLGAERQRGAEEQIASIKIQNTVLAVLAVFTALLAGLWLKNTITQPLNQLVSVLESTSTGDFSRRLDMERSDEFGILVKGYNRMADELAAIVGQVQKSALQVGSSVTEIAAGAKEQEATAVEVTATATEISATSKEISSTPRNF